MENSNASVMRVKDWMITIFIAAIPLVGFVMLFVWGFGSGTNLNKQNWAKAALLWFAIVVALYIILFMMFGAAFLANYSDFDF
jgi:membrane protein YdbS with pleckstrin-like domain